MLAIDFDVGDVVLENGRDVDLGECALGEYAVSNVSATDHAPPLDRWMLRAEKRLIR